MNFTVGALANQYCVMRYIGVRRNNQKLGVEFVEKHTVNAYVTRGHVMDIDEELDRWALALNG